MSEYARRGPEKLAGNFNTLVTLIRHDVAPRGSRNWQEGRRNGLRSLATGILRAPDENLGGVQLMFDALDTGTQGTVHDVFESAVVDMVTSRGDVGRELAGTILAERALKKA